MARPLRPRRHYLLALTATGHWQVSGPSIPPRAPGGGGAGHPPSDRRPGRGRVARSPGCVFHGSPRRAARCMPRALDFSSDRPRPGRARRRSTHDRTATIDETTKRSAGGGGGRGRGMHLDDTARRARTFGLWRLLPAKRQAFDAAVASDGRLPPLRLRLARC